MAINKRKILQSAQKHLQKGALDKALKDYTTLLEADPRDVNLRLKVGDIHLKQGKSAEAAKAYQKVAERFMKDGFDAKAVALFKQITKIDPKRYEVYVPLAELYQRLGLKGDAMEALQIAADALHKEGDKPGALELLRKMASVDPTNTTNRLKVAELLRQEGMNEEAIAEYQAVAEELGRQGDVEGRMNVLEKMHDLDANRPESLEALGRCYVDRRRYAEAEAIALRMVSEFTDHAVEGYEILTEVMTGQGREGEELTAAYRSMANALRDRGEEERAREILQRYAPVSALSVDPTDAADAAALAVEPSDDKLAFDAAIGAGGDYGESGVHGADDSLITDSGLRLDAPRAEFDQVDGSRRRGTGGVSNSASSGGLPPLPSLDESADELALDVPELELEDEALSLDEPAPAAAAAPEAASDGPVDVEQMLAEASVYTRYGKHDRAVESLRAVVAQDPGHRVALEKLGAALEAAGDRAGAAQALLSAAQVARQGGDEAAVAILREQIEALDPAAAASLAAPADAGEELLEDDGIEIDVEDELDLGSDADEAAADASPRAQADVTVFQLEGEENEAAAEDLEEAAAAPLDLDEASADATPDDVAGDFEIDVGGFEGAFDDEDEVLEERDAPSPDLDEGPDEVLLDEQPVPEPIEFDDEDDDLGAEEAAAEAAAGESSSRTQQEIGAELEEGDFFLEQEMLDEAEQVYRRILERAPAHPQALVRLGELEAKRAAAVPPEVAPAPRGDDDATGEFEVDLGEAPDDLLAEADEPPAPLVGSDTTEVDEIDADGETPEAEQAQGPVDPGAAEAPGEAAPGGEAPAERASAPIPQAGETDPGLGAESAEPPTGEFDLAAELSGVFDDDATGSRGVPQNTEQEGFEQVFAAFKRGVEQELRDEDYQARWDLGIAYKEMGLLDDAIGEFRAALADGGPQAQCLHMMGVCALDLGRGEDAVAHVEQALSGPEVSAEEEIALRFDLGRAYQATGDLARARSAYEAVAAVDPEFCEVRGILDTLDDPPPEAGDAGDAGGEEAFESFDDLLGDDPEPDAEQAAAAEAERYESFDDWMDDDGDAEAEPAAAEPEAAPVAAEPEPAAAEPEAAPVAAEPEAAPVAAEPEAAPVAAEPEAAPVAAEPEAAPVAAEPEPEPEVAPAPEPEPEDEPPAPKRRRKKISFL